jgi:hypothetical protein
MKADVRGNLYLSARAGYHALLVASLQPPVQRVVMVSEVEVLMRYRGATFELGCNEFVNGTVRRVASSSFPPAETLRAYHSLSAQRARSAATRVVGG